MSKRNKRKKVKATVRVVSAQDNIGKRGLYNPQYAGYVSDFLKMTQTGQQAIQYDLPTVRNISREMALQDDYIRKYLQILKQNIVGPGGVNLNPSPTTKGGKPDRKLASLIKAEWNNFTRLDVCCPRLSFNDALKMTVESLARDGEVFLQHLTSSAKNKYNYGFTFFEPELLDVMYNGSAPSGNMIRNSIEFDDTNRPIQYWRYRYNPFDYQNTKGQERYAVPAEQVEHLCILERDSQTRGYPWITSSIFRLMMLKKYEDAELIAAQNAAQRSIFLQLQNGVDLSTFLEGMKDEESPLSLLNNTARIGEIPVALPGLSYQTLDSSHPTTAFGEYRKGVLHGIACGLRVPFVALTSDVSEVNFSSARTAMIEFRYFCEDVQGFLEEHFVIPVYERWLKHSLLSGIFPGYGLADYQRIKSCNMVWRSWSAIDPLKDANATAVELQNGLVSHSQVAAEQGQDIEELYAAIAKDKELADSYGLVFAWELNNKPDVKQDAKEVDGNKDDQNKAA
jgi:lambda family phage portal protein